MKNVVHNWRLGTLALCAAVLLPAVSVAQTDTDVKELNKLAAKYKKTSAALQAENERKAKLLGIPMREVTSDGIVREIYRFVNGKPVYRQTFNLGAAQTVGTSKLWPGGSLGLALTGSTMILGEWDGGSALETHQELTGRVVNGDGAASHIHSTHVAGTMIATGIDPNAKGMSYEAILHSYDWDSDSSEMASEAVLGLRLSNHSYGVTYPDWFGMYDDYAVERDTVAYAAPYYLICQSAGNAQAYTTTGYDTLGNPAPAKNILTVAAVNKGTYTGPDSVVMSDFSSFGPTDDGRIKPDISAPGVDIYSCYNDSDTSYGLMSGTSMASPVTTGSLGLIVQYYTQLFPGQRMRSATLKGLAIHCADEAGSFDGPDYRFGWGLLNTAAMAQKLLAYSTNPCEIGEGVLRTGKTFTYKATSDGLNPIKVTMVWTDPAGVATTTTDDTTPKLVNDLDVRVTIGGTTYYPWVLKPSTPSAAATTGDNTLDNVEQIIVPATAGDCEVTVSHKGTKLKPGGSQAYSLIISGLPSPKLTGIVIDPSLIEENKTHVGTITLSGVAPAGGMKVTLTSSDRSLVRTPATMTVPGGESTGTFEYRTLDVEDRTSATITATSFGETFSQDVTVSPGGVYRLELDESSVDGGTSVTGEVELGVPAPEGGAIVRIATDNKKAADLNWAVPVAEGETTASFTITTYPVTKVTAVRVRAAYPGPTKYVTLTVNPPFALSTLALSSATIKGGNTVTGTVTVNRSSSTDTVVTLASSMTSAATVPATVTIPAGSTSANFTITTYAVTSAKTVTISSTYGSTTKTAKLKVNKS